MAGSKHLVGPMRRIEVHRYHCQSRHPFLKYAFRLLCLVGCLYQLTVITMDYTKYRTVTRMRRSVSNDLPVPNLALCVRYTDILDFSQIKTDLNITVNKKGSDVKRAMSLLTLSQVFKYTPPIDSVLVRCAYPVKGSITLKFEHGEECEKHMILSKFYLQEFMCYRFEARNTKTISFDQIGSSLTHAGRIYTLELNRKMLEPRVLKMVAFYGSKPYYSDKLALTLHNHFDRDTGYTLYNTFTVSFTLYKVQLLPFPYDTKCQGTGEAGRINCVQQCLREGLRPVERLPFSGILLQSVADEFSEFKHFNTMDMQNKTMLQLYNDLESECRSSCIYEDCVSNFTTTTVTAETGDAHRFVVNVMIPLIPEAHIETDAAMKWSDYLIYAFSSLGFWMGISIKNLNPFENLPSERDKHYVKMKLEMMWKQRFQVAVFKSSPDKEQASEEARRW